MSRLEVVVGAQFGSEAKGHVVQRLTERAQKQDHMPAVIRVAGPNAGHTGYDAQGRPWALRQVPVAAVTEGPAYLGIAPGSEIDPPVLLDEIDRLTAAGLMNNKVLWVSGEATVISDEHKARENAGFQHTDDLVKRIGSTGKGIGAARADRLMRGAQRVRDAYWLLAELGTRKVTMVNTDHKPFIDPEVVIIEGTQGYGLGLHAGFYPFCTSSNCRASDFMAMAGVHPWEFAKTEVWAVARIFPIRVAGNSGPLRNETSWEELGLPPEFTTVTKKMRRVGQSDWDLVAKAVQANGGAPTVRLAITMVDQLFPELANRPIVDADRESYREVARYLGEVEALTKARIGMVTTGPNTYTWRTH